MDKKNEGNNKPIRMEIGKIYPKLQRRVFRAHISKNCLLHRLGLSLCDAAT